MMQILYVGIIMGAGLFFSKFAIIFFFPSWLKRTINFNNFTLLLTDFGLGALAAKTLSIADGTIALGASITFGVLSISYIISKVLFKRAKKFGGEMLCVSGRY